jgi:uncharacterized protein with GYD domain
MPDYVFTSRYTGEPIKGMIDQLEDRTEALGALIAAFGGRIDRDFTALGDVGFFLAAEFPSNEAAMSCAAVVSSPAGRSPTSRPRRWAKRPPSRHYGFRYARYGWSAVGRHVQMRLL